MSYSRPYHVSTMHMEPFGFAIFTPSFLCAPYSTANIWYCSVHLLNTILIFESQSSFRSFVLPVRVTYAFHNAYQSTHNFTNLTLVTCQMCKHTKNDIQYIYIKFKQRQKIYKKKLLLYGEREREQLGRAVGTKGIVFGLCWSGCLSVSLPWLAEWGPVVGSLVGLWPRQWYEHKHIIFINNTVVQTSEFDEATAQSIPQSPRAANAMGGLLEVAFAFTFVFTMGHRHVLTANKCLGYFRKIRYKITK